jgi:aspartyl protease family protein
MPLWFPPGISGDLQMEEETEKEDTVSRLGRGMILATWIIGLVLLAFFFQSVLDRENNPNSRVQSSINTQGVKEVVLKRNRMGHYVASGSINGQPVIFLLDTGATDVALPGAVAKRLGIEGRATAQSYTAGGTVSTELTRLRQVGLGDIVLTDVRASILETMEGEEVLLGMSFLKRLEMVQRGDTLIVRQYPGE